MEGEARGLDPLAEGSSRTEGPMPRISPSTPTLSLSISIHKVGQLHCPLKSRGLSRFDGGGGGVGLIIASASRWV